MSAEATVIRKKVYQSLQAWKEKKKFLTEAYDVKNKIFFVCMLHKCTEEKNLTEPTLWTNKKT